MVRERACALSGALAAALGVCAPASAGFLTVDSGEQLATVDAEVLDASSVVLDSDTDAFMSMMPTQDAFASFGALASSGDSEATSTTFLSTSVSLSGGLSASLFGQANAQLRRFDDGLDLNSDGLASYSLEFTLDAPAEFLLDFTVTGVSFGALRSIGSVSIFDVSGGVPLFVSTANGSQITSVGSLTGTLGAGTYRLGAIAQASTEYDGPEDSTIQSATGSFNVEFTIVPSPSALIAACVPLAVAGSSRRRR